MTRLAVTLGDPRGIGAEVTAEAVAKLFARRGDVSAVLIGAEQAWTAPGTLETVGRLDGTDAGAGRIAGHAIERAVALALAGEVDAVVTAPIHKGALRAAGYAEPGHTELLARLTGARPVGMLMAAEATRLGGPLRVLLATTHIALRNVPALVTTDLLVEQTSLLDRSLRASWAIAAPRIALCALNPHASDAGLFGDEEARVMTPAVERLHTAGVAVTGPIPADTVFARAIAGEFDAVVAPYHDVGMAPFKTVSFGSGVNVTLGLPFPRTSPDHGTAFDRAGRGTADASSMLEALELACRLTSSGAPSPTRLYEPASPDPS